ncbi:MAG: hypothetical protein LBG45_07750 [Dysgonamonadaceae bacterium]|nr:hypothetical protein [Dysgonamonadaceae bacterium]
MKKLTLRDLADRQPFSFGVSYGSIASDDRDSFAAAFKGENHPVRKKHTVDTGQ